MAIDKVNRLKFRRFLGLVRLDIVILGRLHVLAFGILKTFCVVNLSKASSNNLGSEDTEEGEPCSRRWKDGTGAASSSQRRRGGIGGVIVNFVEIVVVGTQKTVFGSQNDGRRPGYPESSSGLHT
jgi:hypothetical protein